MPASSSRPVRRLFAYGLGLVLLCGAPGYYWITHNQAQATSGAPALSVSRGDIQDNITALGTLQPLDYVDVGVQVSGQLQKLHVQLGDQVEEGQLLAEIDPTLFEAKVVASEAQLKNQRAQLKERQAQHRLAELQLARQRACSGSRPPARRAWRPPRRRSRSPPRRSRRWRRRSPRPTPPSRKTRPTCSTPRSMRR